jgi:hypothetical protein
MIEGRKATLTPTGQLLYHRARYLLDEASGLERSAKRLSAGWEAEIRLAVEIIFPTWLLLECLDRLGRDSPHTRIELIEAVLGHRTDALAQGLTDLAVFASVPPGFLGEALMRLRFVLAARPDHPLHQLGRKLTIRDLRAHRQLVVRESSPERTSAPSIEAVQRWTVSQNSHEFGGRLIIVMNHKMSNLTPTDSRKSCEGLATSKDWVNQRCRQRPKSANSEHWPKLEISSGRRTNHGNAAHRPEGQTLVRSGDGSGNRDDSPRMAGTSPRAPA